MFDMKKNGYMASVAIAGLLLAASPAMAMPTLKLSSGMDTIIVEDGDGNDANGVAGVVTFVGSVGVFDINVSTGLTKPANGSAVFPDIDLNSVNSSNEAGVLTVEFSETDFISSGDTTLSSGVGGTTQGEVTFTVNVDTNNTIFGSSDTVFNTATLTGGNNNEFATGSNGMFSHDGLYSITQIATIEHFGEASTSFDLQTTIPVPATFGMLGIALFGLGVALRRRRA